MATCQNGTIMTPHGLEGCTSGNVSKAGDVVAIWTIFPCLTLVLIVVVLLLNGAALIGFLRHKSHLNSFNVYLANLLIANLLHTLMQKPLDIVNSVYNTAWPLNYGTCTFYLYAEFVVYAAVIHAHLLITMNRVWAVTFPVSYRQNHTPKLALILCVYMWIHVNTLLLPEVIFDAQYYRLSLKNHRCLLNIRAQARLFNAMQFAVYVCPLAFIIAAFPLIWYKYQKRFNVVRFDTSGKVTSVSHKGHLDPPEAVDAPTQAPASRRQSGKGEKEERGVRGRSQRFVLLTALTCSVTVCWSPMVLYFVIDLLAGYRNVTLFYAASMLFLLEAALDPIYFTLAMQDVRQSLFNFGRRKFRQG